MENIIELKEAAALKVEKKERETLKKRPLRTLYKDLTSQTFHYLTAIRPTAMRKEHSVVWECRCKCGNKCYASAKNLMQGKQKSCGCLRREQMQKARDYLHYVDGTFIEQLEHKTLRKDNTSGYPGVTKRKNGKYIAEIGFKGKSYYLGSFACFEDAVAAKREAEEKFHGSFLKEYYQYSE